MPTRRLLLTCAALAVSGFALSLPALSQSGDRLQVVASFSILGDIVARVGGDRIEVATLVGPDGDAHVFQPAPADAELVARADLLVVNGLGFEGWMDRLIQASGTGATVVTATEGLTPIAIGDADAGQKAQAGHDHDHADHDGHEHDHDHASHDGHDHDHDHASHDGHDHDHAGHDHGPTDPHAWQDVASVILYVDNIERALTAADPEGAAVYQGNAAAYRAELEALDAEIRAALAAVPEDRRTIVTSHDSFAYFARAYGLNFMSPQGVSTEAEASARDVAALITQIREQDISAVYVENIADPRLLEQIAAETGARIGDRLFSDSLSAPDGPAGSYVAMMRYNLAQLTQSLGQ